VNLQISIRHECKIARFVFLGFPFVNQHKATQVHYAEIDETTVLVFIVIMLFSRTKKKCISVLLL